MLIYILIQLIQTIVSCYLFYQWVRCYYKWRKCHDKWVLVNIEIEVLQHQRDQLLAKCDKKDNVIRALQDRLELHRVTH